MFSFTDRNNSKTKGKKTKPDSCTTTCSSGNVSYKQGSVIVDSGMSKIQKIKCGKKGYQLSKKVSGLTEFHCSEEGRTAIVNALLTQAGKKEGKDKEGSKQPNRAGV